MKGMLMCSGEDSDARDVGAGEGTEEGIRLGGSSWEEIVNQEIIQVQGSFEG